VQLTANVIDWISATVQAVAYADLTSTWEPRLDWAYLRVKVLPTVTARAGYLRTPTFMFSDSVFIGYANTWVRPPLEVYNQVPAYQLRGADLTWSDSLGPVSVALQTYYGDSEVETGSANTKVKVEDWTGAAASAQYGSVSARVGYSQFEFGGSLAQVVPLVNGLRSVPAAFCGVCSGVADALLMDGQSFKVVDVGMQYDNGSEIVIAEYARSRSDWMVVPDSHGMYVTLGRRFGPFTPYGTYAQSRLDSPTSVTAVPVPALAGGINALLGTRSDQESYTAGVRYEVPAFSVLSGALVKVQYDRIETDGGPGMLNAVQPGFDGSVDMISVSFDAIF
jgi:hypothetical protein